MNTTLGKAFALGTSLYFIETTQGVRLQKEDSNIPIIIDSIDDDTVEKEPVEELVNDIKAI